MIFELQSDIPESRSADHRLLQWLSTVDHKKVGLMYLSAALLFFIIGGAEALLMRTQLAVAENTILGPDAYNQIFTMHGVTMIFFVMMLVFFTADHQRGIEYLLRFIEAYVTYRVSLVIIRHGLGD